MEQQQYKKPAYKSELKQLGIAGFRSYTHLNMEKIVFTGPLTLIWGANGSGKSTIIQILKYITTGSYPPNSQKGKLFIANLKQVKVDQIIANARLKFKSVMGNDIIIVKRVQFTQKKNIFQIKSLDNQIKYVNQKGTVDSFFKKCKQMSEMMPRFLGVPKAVLQYVSFCHQEQSFWPFGQNSVLKDTFDALFQTMKANDCIQKLHNEIKEHRNKLAALQKVYPMYLKNEEGIIQKNAKNLDDMIDMASIAEKLFYLRNQISKENQEKKQMSQLLQNEKKYLCKQVELKVNITNIQKQMSSYAKTSNIKVLENISQYEKIKINITKQKDNLIIKQKNNEAIYQELRKTEQTSMIDIQINTQCNRIRQIIPQLKGIKVQTNLIQQLKKKCQELQALVLKKIKMEKQIPSLQNVRNKDIVNIKENIQAFEKKLNKQNQKLSQLHKKISESYNFLYKKPQSLPKMNVRENAEEQLIKLRYKIQLKKQQIQRCKKMQKPDPSKNIDRLQFAGIIMQKQMICFCKQKKKCMYCHHQMSQQEIKSFIKKRQKTIQQYVKKISQIQRQKKDVQIEINPQKIINNNLKFLKEAQQIEDQLLKQVEYLHTLKQNQKIIQLNNLLSASVQQISKFCQKQLKLLPNSHPKQCKKQQFLDYCRQYVFTFRTIGQLVQTIQNDKKKLRQSQANAKENMRKQKIIQQMRNQMDKINSQLMNKRILQNIYKNLKELLEKKEKIQKPKSKTKHNVSLNQISQQLKSIKMQIQQKINYLNEITLSIKYTELYWMKQNLIRQFNKNKQQKIKNQTILRDLNEKLEKYNSSKQQYSMLNASMMLKRRNINDHISNQEFLNLHFEMILQKQILEQLEQYQLCLQKAISLVHQQKLSEINETIKQIWSAIYHQKDIQEIGIHAISQGNKRKKSYHYRIFMLRKGIQTNMKGSCSSGQKVLASLVIRIALATVLAKNGTKFMTLDQPTTHLDHQHTIKLAKQISSLMDILQGQIQLIIISHDPVFINALSDKADNYFCIKRGEDGFSKINQVSQQDLVNQLRKCKIDFQGQDY